MIMIYDNGKFSPIGIRSLISNALTDNSDDNFDDNHNIVIILIYQKRNSLVLESNYSD